MSWFRPTPDELRVKALKKLTALAGSGKATGMPSDALGDYLATPFPSPETPVEELALLAVDLETTGLDPTKDRALSVGFVPVNGLTVDLSGARHIIINEGREVGQSATVHGLTDDHVASAGVSPVEALTEVLRALAGRVLVAHFSVIETGFLAAATERVWGVKAPALAVDTLELQRRLTTAWNAEPKVGTLRLWPARARWGLPPYKAHEALIDAVACAELYLAQVSRLRDVGPVTLARLR